MKSKKLLILVGTVCAVLTLMVVSFMTAAACASEKEALPPPAPTAGEEGNTETALEARYLTVALCQVDVWSMDPDLEARVATNLENVKGQARFVAFFDNPDMIVFPEILIPGPELDPANASLMAEPIPGGPICQEMAALAKELGVWLIPGSIFEAGPNGEVYNTAIVLSPEGELVAKFQKKYPAVPEEQCTPGEWSSADDYAVFEIPGKGKVGVLVCYDAYFPEPARVLAWRGAELIIQLSLGAPSSIGPSPSLQIARAFENQCYYAFCNVGRPTAEGGSCFVDPEGRVLEMLGEVPATLCATLNLAEVYRVREYGTWIGICPLKHWAYMGPKTFPCYEQGIENGEVFKTLSKTYPQTLDQVKRYPGQK